MNPSSPFAAWFRRWRRRSARPPRWRPAIEPLEDRLTPSAYFVDQVHGSAGGDGSSAHPFQTIDAANRRAFAGDTVFVAPGTYDETVTVRHSGTAAAPLIFIALSGGPVTVTGGADGFVVSGKSYVTIDGFHVTGTSSYGIFLLNASHVNVVHNEVSAAGLPADGLTAFGIKLTDTSDSRVAHNLVHNNSDSGIQLSGASTGNEITDNVVYANARGYLRAAAGIDVRAPGNTVAHNVCHDNEDSGIQFVTPLDGTSSAANNLATGNLAYNNGDHGINVLRAPGVRVVGNTVYGNLTAGIDLEGGSTGATVGNNISVNNGLPTSPRNQGDILVDAASQPGLWLDYNLVFSPPGAALYVWGGIAYTTLHDFTLAIGQEAHGIQADPHFVNAAAGDFHLAAGSPAIDSADSGLSGERVKDLDGRRRVNDPATPNTGAGLSPFYDRGAFEFRPPRRPGRRSGGGS